MEHVIWISACPNVAVKNRVMAYTETILGRVSRCAKRLESFTLSSYWGASALDDGFEAFGFKVLARTGGGLRIGVRPDLNAIIFVHAGRDDSRPFLQSRQILPESEYDEERYGGDPLALERWKPGRVESTSELNLKREGDLNGNNVED